MAFDRAFLDELSARNDIVETVSHYVALKKSGRNYFGLCPFHNERSPSFSVSAEKQIFHCFGCNAGGGVISFVMKIEGMTFPETVRLMAEKSGMEIPDETETERKAARHRDRLYALCKDAARFYYDALWQEHNHLAQEYFAVRGLSRRLMNRFGLGYAPDSFHALMDAMQEKGYSKEELMDAGLLARSEKGRMYDRFRGRVMFPIIDVQGRVIAFGGRVLDDSKPKYLNSPETPIFHKSRNLFALNLAKNSKTEYMLLAEGYMDVIALHGAGFDSAVASLGTSLTEEQARIIARHKDEIVICYDADTAGQAAAQRAIEILKKCDLRVRVLKVPGAKDPDEFIKSKGADAFRNLISHSENHNIYRIEQIAGKYDLEEDEARVAFLREAARMLATIDGDVEREVYADRVARMAKVSKDAVANEVKHERSTRLKKQKQKQKREIRSPVRLAQPKDRMLNYEDVKSAKAEEGILNLIFYDQKLLPQIIENLPVDWFSSPLLRKIYEQAIQLDSDGRIVSIAQFEGTLEENEMSHLSAVLSRSVTVTNPKEMIKEYIDAIAMQRVRAGKQEEIEEDPLLTFGRIKKYTQEDNGYGK